MNARTGDYTRHINDDILKTYYFTFKPRPLLDGSFYAFDEELVARLTEAHRILGALSGVFSVMPGREHFAEIMCLKESCCSRIIDYTEPNLFDAMIAYGLGTPNECIQSIASAYGHNVKKRFARFYLSDIATHALYGKSSRKQVHHRTKPMFLSHSSASFQQYNPTAPEHISSSLSDLVRYLQESNADPIIKAAMCHYQLEMIHPYDCYNGIIGRMLTHLILHDAGLVKDCYLAMSKCLLEQKTEYFHRLEQAQQEGRFLDWITFFVQTITKAAQRSLCAAERYRESVNRTDAEIVRYVQQRMVSNVANTAHHLCISISTTTRRIGRLCENGTLVQITKGARNRFFAHKSIMEIFCE